MAKNTMGTKLPRKLDQKMQIVGADKAGSPTKESECGSGG